MCSLSSTEKYPATSSSLGPLSQWSDSQMEGHIFLQEVSTLWFTFLPAQLPGTFCDSWVPAGHQCLHVTDTGEGQPTVTP